MGEVRICSFTHAKKALQCGDETLARLLKLVDIPEFGEVGDRSAVGAARLVRLAETITCKHDLWDSIGRAGWVIENEADLDRYIAIRRLLVDKHTAHPPEAALIASKLEGKGATKHQIFRRLGGTFKGIGPVMEVINRALGKPVREQRRSLRSSDLSLQEFLRHHPLFLGLEGTCEDPEFKGRDAPPNTMLGRVQLMKSKELAEMLGLMLMVAPGRGTLNTADVALRLLEQLDEVADGAEPALGDALLARLKAFTIDDVFELPVPTRNNMIQIYKWMRTMLRGWCDELPPHRRSTFERLIPPALTPILAEAAELIDRETREGRSERRKTTAAPISHQRELFLNVAELRFRQADRLIDKIVIDLREIERALAAGTPVAFPVTVSDTYFVVRPDAEGAGNGTQSISVRIETAAEIWEQVLRADMAAGMVPSRSTGWVWLSAAGKQRLVPRGEDEAPYVDGRSWYPELQRELKVVYVATRPTSVGGEVVEPFWTTLFRGRLFDPDKDMTTAERDERKALVKAIGFDPVKAPCPGLLSDTSDTGKAMSRAYRRSVSKTTFVFPAEDFRYALAIGRGVMRPELMRGMRIGESSQARSDPGAFSFRKFDGKIFFYVSVVPKMGRGRPRRMVLDPITVMALERIRVIGVDRWFREEGQLATRPYHFKGKKLDPARYLFANASRTLIYAEMNLCLRVLTVGVISSASHSYKFGFAAMLKRGKAPGGILNRGLNHVGGSDHSDAYARFFTDHSVDAFIAEQQEESRRMELDYALMETV